MSRYAQGTTVPVKRSLEEIEHLAERFGANDFIQVKRGGRYQCWWEIEGTPFTAQLDYRDAPDDREIRRRWRVIVQHIKAQLVAVDEGLLKPRAALLPFMMLPSGEMMGNEIDEQIKRSSGLELPALMAPK